MISHPAGFKRCSPSTNQINWIESLLNKAKLYPQMPDAFGYPLSVTSELINKGFFVAQLDGTPAGIATFAISPTDPNLAIVAILIGPAQRNQGLGSKALSTIIEAVQKAGGKRLLTKVYSSQKETVRFLEQHAFQETGRSHIVFWTPNLKQPNAETQLDLVKHRADSGLRFVQLDHFPRISLADRLIDIWNQTQPDQPQHWPFEPISAKQFERDILDTDEIDYAHSFAAVTASNRVVGLSLNGVDEQKRLWCHYTAVDPDFRGRKLGLMLKSHLLDNARSAGIVQVAAENDAENIPMQKINRALGFQTVAEWVTFEKGLATQP